MKISKIPGLGRFGVFIDDVDFDTITDDEWIELGQLHLSSLVTILRNVNLSTDTLSRFIHKWGTDRNGHTAVLTSKYKNTLPELGARVMAGDTEGIDQEDLTWIKNVLNIMTAADGVHRVTGRKTATGEPLGLFAEGELHWHSNEAGTLTFTPGVALLAKENVVGSATCFLTTTDWYERQSESFRSELDDMIMLHRFMPGKVTPGLRPEQEVIVYKNMCPVDDTAIPMVIQSPGGIRGLHYSVNTMYKIQGMSEAESQRLFDRISKELFVDEFMYDHWYQEQDNNDLLLFDNSITLHRRLGGVSDRLCYRIQYDYSKLYDTPYQPYFQSEFAEIYRSKIRNMIEVLRIKDFPLS